MYLVQVCASHRALVEIREPRELLFTFHPAWDRVFYCFATGNTRLTDLLISRDSPDCFPSLSMCAGIMVCNFKQILGL